MRPQLKRAFVSLGCRVVALEPQPDFARLLRTWYAGSSGIEIIEAAAGQAPGRASLSISERTPTVTTLATAWRDALIARFGLPAFVKIDVEGAEPAVLAGLTRAVPALSFEYLPRALDHVHACVTRLAALGAYRFNWSAGESYGLAEPAWLNDRELLEALRNKGAQRQSGDVYATLEVWAQT